MYALRARGIRPCVRGRAMFMFYMRRARGEYVPACADAQRLGVIWPTFRLSMRSARGRSSLRARMPGVLAYLCSEIRHPYYSICDGGPRSL